MVYVDPQEVPQNREAFLSEGEIIVVRSGAYTADSAIIPPQQWSSNRVRHGTEANGNPPEFLGMALMTKYLRDDQLIADVVTGQLDVREAAEELPTPEPTEITD